MGGFAKLKDDFERWFPALDLERNWKTVPTGDKGEQAAFRHLYLRCLFEIAGNLDTIALCSRALVEQSDKRNRIAEVNQERLENALEKMLEATRELINRPTPPVIVPVLDNLPGKKPGKKNAGA